MNRLAGHIPRTVSVISRQLRWSLDDVAGDLRNILKAVPGNKFDVVIAADCLFFEDFHEALIDTILHALGSCRVCSAQDVVELSDTLIRSEDCPQDRREGSSESCTTEVTPMPMPMGACWLLQPSRDKSMERFMDKARQHFNITVVSDYNSEVLSLCRLHTISP